VAVLKESYFTSSGAGWFVNGYKMHSLSVAVNTVKLPSAC